MKKSFAALVAALPLATFAQYDPATLPAGPEGSAAPAPAASAPLAPPPPAGWAPAPGQPASPRPYAPLRQEKQRGSWYIGFGLGGGGGSVSDGSGTHAFTAYVAPAATTLSLDFNVGATLTPQVLLGLDVGAVASLSSSGGEDTQIQTTYYDAAVTFFPWERGLFVKGGVGLSALTLDQGSLGNGSWRGYNVMGGIGYAWWLGSAFNLAVTLDGSKAWYGSNGPDSTQSWSLQLGFEWY